MSTTPVLEFRNISRSFRKGAPVLSDVSFNVAREEVVALLGRNGSGKTTLIHIAMGMLFPHEGDVRVFGMSPTARPVDVKKRIGYVAEDQVLPPNSNIQELLAFHRYLFKSWDASLEKQLLERFELDGNTWRISQLSKGQARQVALICAVCHRPDLLILDEPAGGLDPAARREFLETSIQLLNRNGTAILFSSHHMGDVERLGGRVVLLDEGRVKLDRQLDDLREKFCIAIIPRYAARDVTAIERLPGCVQVKAVVDQWHAVFKCTPEEASLLFATELGLANVQCTTIPLEEMFIELVGGKHTAEAS